MENELIVVKQLPIIEDQLRTVKANIQATVDYALSLECNETTVKQVKKVRAELNAQYQALEANRKKVKAQIEAPYKAFEAVYKECAGDLFSDADKKLKKKIDDVEDGIRDQRKAAVKAYYEEYKQSVGIPDDIAPYDKSGISVTLTASEKSLKKACKDFLDRVNREIDLIKTNDHANEILVEYKTELDMFQAIKTVSDRYAELAKMEADRVVSDKIASENERREQAVKDVVAETSETEDNALSAPVVTKLPEHEKVYEVSFTVRGTLDELKALKKFLNDGGYEYEQNKRNGGSAA